VQLFVLSGDTTVFTISLTCRVGRFHFCICVVTKINDFVKFLPDVLVAGHYKLIHS
jgi:hypothetical protein